MKFMIIGDITLKSLQKLSDQIVEIKEEKGVKTYFAPDDIISELKLLEKMKQIRILDSFDIPKQRISSFSDLARFIEKIEKLEGSRPGESDYILWFKNKKVELPLSHLRSRKKLGDALYDAFGCELTIDQDEFTDFLLWVAEITTVVEKFEESQTNMLASIVLREIVATSKFVDTREEFAKYSHAVMRGEVDGKGAVMVKSAFIKETMHRKSIDMDLTVLSKELRHETVRPSKQSRFFGVKMSVWYFKPEVFDNGKQNNIN